MSGPVRLSTFRPSLHICDHLKSKWIYKSGPSSFRKSPLYFNTAFQLLTILNWPFERVKAKAMDGVKEHNCFVFSGQLEFQKCTFKVWIALYASVASGDKGYLEAKGTQIPILRTMIYRLEVISFSDNCCQVKLNTDSAQLNLILFRLVKFQELMPGTFTLVSSQWGGGLQLNRDYEVNTEYGGNLPNVLALISSKFKI